MDTNIDPEQPSIVHILSVRESNLQHVAKKVTTPTLPSLTKQLLSLLPSLFIRKQMKKTSIIKSVFKN